MPLTLRQIMISAFMVYSAFVSAFIVILFMGDGSTRFHMSPEKYLRAGVRSFKYEASKTGMESLDENKEQNATASAKGTMPFSAGGDAWKQLITDAAKRDCPDYPPTLKGRLQVDANFVPTEEEAILAAGPEVQNGCFEPKECNPTQTLALIVPFKNRQKHLTTLMYHLHPILQRQWIRYCIFVPEQYDDGAFNKGRVMNAGFLEIMKTSDKYDCLVFHDVDMLLEDDRNLYKCDEWPKHLSPALEKFNYTVNYGTDFGGVGAVSTHQYKLANGHSDRFYGWGGEDSDIELRYKLLNLKRLATNAEYGRYKMMPHEHPWYFNPLSGIGSFKKSGGMKKYDENVIVGKTDSSGLSTIKYSVTSVLRHKLYTKITLDVRTLLINTATVSFKGHKDSARVENPWLTNDRLGTTDKKSVRGYGIQATDEFPNYGCHYQQFKNKTVNVTLGEKENATYLHTYENLEKAKDKCSRLAHYCQSILEISPGRYQLRSTAFMHENSLTYRLGLIPQVLYVEKHTDVSVYVKICPDDSRYLHFIDHPVIAYDGDSKNPDILQQAEFDLQLYRVENISLFYSIKVYSTHKAILKDRELVAEKSLGVYDTLCETYEDSVFVLNVTDKSSIAHLLPQGVKSLEELALQDNPVLQVRTPLLKIPRVPGCYVCESVISDQHGTPHLNWKWWFEIRGDSPNTEKKLLDLHLKTAKARSTEFTEGVRGNFQKALSISEQLHLSDDIMNMIAASLTG